jgi:alpha-L-fucosidase
VSTYREKTVYLHILNRPGDTIELPSIGAKIVRSKALTGGKIRVIQTGEKISISLPPGAMKGNDIIIALVLDRQADEIEPLSMDL